jgi:hypothetical protein
MDGKTSISEIHDSFLSKISEYTYLALPTEEIAEDLLRFYKSARPRFRECTKDLSLDKENLLINSELDEYEIEIIVNLMLVEWLRPNMLSSNVIKQNLSDKDFKIHSQASQLSQIKEAYKYLKQESNKMITKYTYFDLDKETMG